MITWIATAANAEQLRKLSLSEEHRIRSRREKNKMVQKLDSATFDMGFEPEKYGARLFAMEEHGDAQIREALMDIGKRRTMPHQTIHSAKEYQDLVKSISGIVYSCRFKAVYKDLDVTVLLDFETEKLTLQVDPGIGKAQKTQLAEFFEILTTPDYYEQKDEEEMEEIEEEIHPPLFLKRLARVAGVVLIASIGLDLMNFFPEFDKLLGYLKWISLLVVMAYFVGFELKKRQVQRQRQEEKKGK